MIAHLAEDELNVHCCAVVLNFVQVSFQYHGLGYHGLDVLEVLESLSPDDFFSRN